MVISVSRQPREYSPSGIYHIMSRGINKMAIYVDSHDRLRYIDILLRVKKATSFELYAFCLMSNHNHLLLKEANTNISKIMASINIRYSMYFNGKYSRVGSLIQERFRSEPIKSESQLLTCARYIHNNPVKAGIVKSPGKYRWSSYHDYLDNSGEPLLNTEFMLNLFGLDSVLARSKFISSSTEANDDSYIDCEPEEDELRKQIERLVRTRYNHDLSHIRSMDFNRRKEIIAYIVANSSLSYAQLGRILNLSKDSIYRACRKNGELKK